MGEPPQGVEGNRRRLHLIDLGQERENGEEWLPRRYCFCVSCFDRANAWSEITCVRANIGPDAGEVTASTGEVLAGAPSVGGTGILERRVSAPPYECVE